ncbi:hypothetical protein pb186bvf_020905 [Paramecium bursaria]
MNSFKIQDASIAEDGLLNFVVYKIQIQHNGDQYVIKRRFNDFVILKEALIHNWPGCFIPPIPQKKSIGNMDINVIKYRQKYLSIFMKKLITIDYLWQSKEIELFIKSENPHQSLQEHIKSLQIEDIIEKYKQIFGFDENQGINYIEIDNFQLYINSTAPMIENFQKMAKNILIAKDQYNYEQILFIESFLPQFESAQLTQEILFADEETKQQFQEVKKLCQQNEFLKLVDYTKTAERFILSCKDALMVRSNYAKELQECEEKLNKNKISLQEIHTKTFFFSNKEEQQTKLKNLQTQLEQRQQALRNQYLIGRQKSFIKIIKISIGQCLSIQQSFN